MRQLALKLLIVAGLAFAPALPSLARDQAQVSAARSGFDPAKLAAIVDWLKADVDKGRIPGAVVLVVRDGKVLLHEAVGWADKDKKIAMQRNSIHPIASSTKLITTVAALRLFEANKLQIMAPIATYLPELKDLKISRESRDAAGAVTTELVAPARQPTVHDLMTHRAGLHLLLLSAQSAAQPLSRARHRPHRHHERRRDAAEACDAAAGVLARHLVRIFDRDRSARPHRRARDQEAAGRRAEGAGARSAQDAGHDVPRSGRGAGAIRAAAVQRSRHVGVRMARRHQGAEAVFRRRRHGVDHEPIIRGSCRWW